MPYILVAEAEVGAKTNILSRDEERRKNGMKPTSKTNHFPGCFQSNITIHISENENRKTCLAAIGRTVQCEQANEKKNGSEEKVASIQCKVI